MSLFKRWDKRVSTEDTNELLSGLAREHLQEVVFLSNEREQLSHLIDSGDLLGVCNFDLNPRTCERYLEGSVNGTSLGTLAMDYYHLAQVIAFFKKRSDLDLGVDKSEVAWTTFEESERRCLEMNRAFQAWKQGRYFFRPHVEHVLHVAQRKISHVLGRCPTIDEVPVRLGPGATTQVKKSEACAKVKLSQALACSGDFAALLPEALATLPHLLGDGDVVTATVEIHPGKLVTVPKSWKTDRTVMVEPYLNGLFQLGVGDLITARIRSKAGIDLSDQTTHRRLARENSITGELATLDLSSASDTISVGLVEHLLPPDWFDLLSVLRTSMCVRDGGLPFRLEKFSSMGNGFTFPLETLIFWALVDSVPGCSGRTSVYGDDILCPSQHVNAVVDILSTCGFLVNSEKSFWEGHFRESCGGDYFFGYDVRPLFIKDRMSGHDAFRLHNFYKRSYSPLWERILRYIPEHLRLFGPDGYGDGVLLTDGEWGYRSRKLRRNQWGGKIFDSFSFRKRVISDPLPGDRILPLYTSYVSSPEQTEHTREGVPLSFVPGRNGYYRIAIYTLG